VADLDDGRAEPRLELAGGALGDDPAAVDDGDPVGEAVGLLQVLRREQQRAAARDDPARRGGRLVELTPDGRRLARDARRILDELEGRLGAERASGLRALLAGLGGPDC